MLLLIHCWFFIHSFYTDVHIFYRPIIIDVVFWIFIFLFILCNFTYSSFRFCCKFSLVFVSPCVLVKVVLKFQLFISPVYAFNLFHVLLNSLNYLLSTPVEEQYLYFPVFVDVFLYALFIVYFYPFSYDTCKYASCHRALVREAIRFLCAGEFDM